MVRLIVEVFCVINPRIYVLKIRERGRVGLVLVCGSYKDVGPYMEPTWECEITIQSMHTCVCLFRNQNHMHPK